MIPRDSRSSRSPQNSPATTPHSRGEQTSSSSSESSHESLFGLKAGQKSAETSLEVDQRQDRSQHQKLIARAKKEETSPLLNPGKISDKLSFSRTSISAEKSKTTGLHNATPNRLSRSIQKNPIDDSRRMEEAISKSSANIQLGGEKRPRQPSPPASSSSRLRLDDYEAPKPPARTKPKFISDLISSSEEKSAKAAQSVSNRAALTDQKKSEEMKQLLRPNDTRNRGPNFGATFDTEGKESIIMGKHSYLGLKSPKEVRDFTQKFWQNPCSSQVIERSQKDGSLIRIDKLSGNVAIATIDSAGSGEVRTKTLFNPGISSFPQESEFKQREISLQYFLRQ